MPAPPGTTILFWSVQTFERTWFRGTYNSPKDSLLKFFLEKANFAYFVSRPLGEKLLKYLFWQKWEILKVLKVEKANFAHFVSLPLGEKLLRHIFWQKWGILKALNFQNLKKQTLLIL